MGTFLHTRRFLFYHGERFVDVSVVIENGENDIISVFPAAEDPADKTCVVSHPGITYGGMVHDGRLHGQIMIDAIELLMSHYRNQGYGRVKYKAVPYIYHQRPSSDDLYAIFRLGGARYRCDLSAAIDLSSPWNRNEQRQRGLKKAIKSNVIIKADSNYIQPFWKILRSNLETKYSVSPVHAENEMEYLASSFPANIQVVVALKGDRIVAGTVLFRTPTTDHVQYIGSSEEGKELNALDAVFEYCISQAKGSGKRYFDFGISTEDGGKVLNEGLYRFKQGFGARGIIYDFYELALR
jgi:hypothetical protein